jgi:hypothetical protein
MTSDIGVKARAPWFFASIFAVTLALRLCHVNILWADEDYHLAAGMQTLDGKLLYRDLWYDKPPLAALVYAAMGALPGWPLRLFDALFVLAVSIATWRFARDLWGRREAFLAAGLMAFLPQFRSAAAVIPIAPDMFLLLPHIVAVHCAWKGKALAGRTVVRRGVSVPGQRSLRAGGVRAAGVARASRAGGGIRHPNAACARGTGRGGRAAVLFPAGMGVERGLRAQFARTPSAGSTDCAARRLAGIPRGAGIGAAAFWWENRKRENYWLAGWLVLSFAGVALGARFFPRYFLQILPPMVLLASHALARRKGGRLDGGSGAAGAGRPLRTALRDAGARSVRRPPARVGGHRARSGQPRRGGDREPAQAPRRYAVRVGLSAGHLCIYAHAGRFEILGLAGAHRSGVSHNRVTLSALCRAGWHPARRLLIGASGHVHGSPGRVTNPLQVTNLPYMPAPSVTVFGEAQRTRPRRSK